MTTLYEKRGRRYFPVLEHDAYAGLPKGYYLLRIEPGSTSVSKTTEPDFAAVELAMRDAIDAMTDAMRKSCECLPPKRTPLTPRQKRGWEAWKREVGDDAMFYFEGVSMQDVVEAGIAALRKKMKYDADTKAMLEASKDDF